MWWREREKEGVRAIFFNRTFNFKLSGKWDHDDKDPGRSPGGWLQTRVFRFLCRSPKVKTILNQCLGVTEEWRPQSILSGTFCINRSLKSQLKRQPCVAVFSSIFPAGYAKRKEENGALYQSSVAIATKTGQWRLPLFLSLCKVLRGEFKCGRHPPFLRTGDPAAGILTQIKSKTPLCGH